MNDEKKINKKSKRIMFFNVLLNISILAMLGVFAWMMTNASTTENLEYSGNLVITDNNVDVKLFVLKDNEYIEQSQLPSEPLINVKTLEPGAIQKYRFDVYNNIDTIASITKIVFTEIYGDVDLLKGVLEIRSTSPRLFSFKLEDRLEYDAINEHHYFYFLDKLTIPGNDMVSLYFNISIDKKATNEIQDTFFSINKVMFINP